MPAAECVALLGQRGEQVAGDHHHAEQQHAFVDEAGHAAAAGWARVRSAGRRGQPRHLRSVCCPGSGATEAAERVAAPCGPRLRQQGLAVDESGRRGDLRQAGLLVRGRGGRLGHQRGAWRPVRPARRSARPALAARRSRVGNDVRLDLDATRAALRALGARAAACAGGSALRGELALLLRRQRLVGLPLGLALLRRDLLALPGT